MRKSAAEIAGAVMEGQAPAPAAQEYETKEAAPKEKKSGYPEFSTPDSFQPPAGISPNEDFKAVGTFRMKEGGTMCLVAVDGSPVKT